MIGTVSPDRPGKHRVVVEFSAEEAEMLARAVHEHSRPGYRATVSGLIRAAVRGFILPGHDGLVNTNDHPAILGDSALLPGREHQSEKKGGIEQASASETERPA